MNSKHIILLIAFCLAGKVGYPQNECKIYNLTVDSLYKKITNFAVDSRQTRLDPTKGLDHTSADLEKIHTEYFVYLDNFLEFKSSDVKDWFADALQDSSLKIKKYNVNRRKKMTNCDWGSLAFCYSIRDSLKDKINYDTLSKCDLFGQRSLQNVSISISPILYSIDNKQALMYLKLKNGFSRGNESFWLFVLRKKKNLWTISKMVGKPR